MATKYSEAVLAVKYREKEPYGMRGRPMYYLEKVAFVENWPEHAVSRPQTVMSVKSLRQKRF